MDRSGGGPPTGDGDVTGRGRGSDGGRNGQPAGSGRPGVPLDAWTAEVRATDAVAHRRRASWLRRQASEEATLGAVLVDLAEHGRAVNVATTTGGRHRGTITIVGRDVVGICPARSATTLVRIDSIEWVRADPGSVGVVGDEAIDPSTTMRRELARLHQDRGPSVLRLRSGEVVGGEVTGVGRDVVSVGTGGNGQVYVPLYSVVEVSLAESG